MRLHMPPFIRRRLPPLLALAGLVVLSAWAGMASAASLTVFAPASLKESLDAAAQAYQRQAGVRLRVAYAASSALARQIEQGAPAQVFISADGDWMDYLQQRGRIDPASRRDLLGNSLVLIAPAGRARAVDLAKPGDLLQALGNGRLAVGQTTTVPAGKYARSALQHLGLWEAVLPRLAESENVRTALMLVARGEAPLGIVYASDAMAEPRVQVVARFPSGSHPSIVYPVATTTAAGPAAAAMVAWLGSPEAGAIFQRHGFTVLD
jgi:molybdate transport system substrate-binding protein